MQTNLIEKYYDFEKYILNFETKSFSNKNSTSAKAKGKLIIYMYKDGWVIRDWNIEFSYLEIDIYTTPKWFEKENKNSNFRKRKSLFDYIFNNAIKSNKVEQIKRVSRSENKLIKLNEEEINKTNIWFNNNYKNEKGTLKNIISILKGNNAGGSFKNVNSAEIYISDLKKENNKYKWNLIMFMDLIMNNINKQNLTDLFSNDILNNFDVQNSDQFIDKILSWNSIINLGEILDLTSNQNIFNRKEKYMNVEKFIKDIKYNKIINNFINNKVQKERNVASQINVLIFNKIKNESGIIDENINYENAHIYNISSIKKELFQYTLKARKNNESLKHEEIANTNKFQKILKQASDINNLLNLEKNFHTNFDKNFYTYEENGNIKILKSGFQLNNLLKNNYSIIPANKLTNSMKHYIRKRNIEIESKKC